MITIENYLVSVSQLATEQGYQVHEIGDSAKHRIIAIQRKSLKPRSNPFRLYLSAGIHGDEPAGPLALLSLLENRSLPDDVDIVICPLINPSGIAASTRENDKGFDLNRDFRVPQNWESKAVVDYLSELPAFDLSICLHEDWESSGFYLYALTPEFDQRIPRQILDAVSRIGPLDLSLDIDGNSSENGLIQRPFNIDLEAREDWPEAFFLYAKHSHLHLTTESPSSFPIEERIEMHAKAILTAIQLSLADRID